MIQWLKDPIRAITIRKLKRKLFHLLPETKKFDFLRKSIVLPYDLPEGLICKVAESKDELQQAFHILHDEYVRMGYMTPNAVKLRVTPWHALPTTTTLIAKIGKEIVGTVSVIRNGMLGVPLEKVFATDELKSGHKRIAEISALAITKSAQGSG